MENQNNQFFNGQNPGNEQNDPNMQAGQMQYDPNLGGQPQNAGGIYYDPTAMNEAPVSGKQKSKLPLILIVIVLVLILACCCGIPSIVGIIFLFIPDAIPSSSPFSPYPPTVDKPVIYLYPTEQTEVTVQVSDPELLTVTYPDYREGWSVLADPDGTLTDPETLRTYYSLYYESNLKNVGLLESKEGFLVAGEDSAQFLEEKLEILGLTEREAEEMIIYWLPQLTANDYNLIRFATADEIEEQMQLNICPEPDSVIRVWMEFEAVDAENAEEISSELTEQELVTPERSGFTVVEWGGVRVE